MLYDLARPLLHRIDPETAHRLTLRGLKLMPGVKCAADDAALEVSLWGRRFVNPVGLAAGFDKNAEVIGPMLVLVSVLSRPGPSRLNPKTAIRARACFALPPIWR